jgi:hypothetical protein
MIPQLLKTLHNHDKERREKLKADKKIQEQKLTDLKISINKFGHPK